MRTRAAIAALSMMLAMLAGLPALAENVTLRDVQEAQSGTQYWGENVLEIKLILPGNMNKAQVMRAIKLREERPFTPSRVRRSIERIYLMGGVEDVIVKAKHDDQGRLVVYIEVVPAYTVRSISFAGNTRFNHDELLRATRIVRGSTFDETMLPPARRAIREMYQDEGFFSVRATTRVERDEGEYAVDLFFDVQEGQRYKIEDVMIIGEAGVPEDLVRKKLHWSQGRVAKKRLFDRGVDRLEGFYRRHGYLEAIVSEPALVIDTERHTVTAQINVQSGKIIEVNFNKPGFRLWERAYRMRRIIELKTRRRFNKWIMEDWRQTIRIYLQSKGYYEAEVTATYEEPEDQNVKRMNFGAERGGKVKIERIDFEGNRAFTEKELRRALGVGDAYVPELFQGSMTKVTRLYQSSGYLQVKVDGPEVNYDRESRKMVLRMKIDEGPRTFVEAVNFEGNQVFSSGELAAQLPRLTAGAPLDPWTLKDSDTLVLRPYFEQGYIRARVTHRLDFNEGRTSAAVTYTVDEGMQYFFGNIYIRGNVLTKDHVIRRELFIEEDSPFDYEQIVQSEQNLMALGLFRSVRIAPVHPDLTDQVVDLVCEVTERSAGTIEWGAGYNTADGWQASFKIAHNNLAGHGRKLSFANELWVTDPTFVLDKRKSIVDFVWPWIARIPIDGRITFGNELSQEISYKKSVYSITPGVDVPLSKFFRWLKSTRRSKGLIRASQHITLSLFYGFEQDFIYKIDKEAVEDKGFIKIATITPMVVRDDRDDVYNPTRGSVNAFQIEYSTPLLQSDVHYLKWIGRTSWYFPAFEIVPLKGLVYAVQLRGGHAQSLDPNMEVPITKRFFLGGSATMRGFANDEISPIGPDGKTKVGGLAMAHLNQELRFPITGGFGGLLFFDAGNVWKDSSHIDWKESRTSAGIGLRYLTPVGPISADYGFKLDREPGESIGEFYITIGNAF